MNRHYNQSPDQYQDQEYYSNEQSYDCQAYCDSLEKRVVLLEQKVEFMQRKVGLPLKLDGMVRMKNKDDKKKKEKKEKETPKVEEKIVQMTAVRPNIVVPTPPVTAPPRTRPSARASRI